MNKKIYIFRHGESVWNAKKLLQSQRQDISIYLSPKGKNQAAKLAEELEGKGIEKIYSSDLNRAKQTARIVSDQIGAEIVLDQRLRDVDFGTLTGNHANMIEEIFPDFKKCFEDTSLNFPNGENIDEVVVRVKEFFDEVLAKDEKIIAISSHRGTIKFFLNKMIDEGEISLNNCGFVVINYDNETKKMALETE